MTQFFIMLFSWVCFQMNVDPAKVTKPEIQAIEPEEMAMLICGKPEVCDNFMPAYYDGEKIYILKNDGNKPMNWERDRVSTSYIVHDMVHHIQLHYMYKGDLKSMTENIKPLESQALGIQGRWIKSLSVSY